MHIFCRWPENYMNSTCSSPPPPKKKPRVGTKCVVPKLRFCRMKSCIAHYIPLYYLYAILFKLNIHVAYLAIHFFRTLPDTLQSILFQEFLLVLLLFFYFTEDGFNYFTPMTLFVPGSDLNHYRKMNN